MQATLYGFPLSHPVTTARLALAHKGIAVTERTLLPGLHPLLLAAAGFRPTTVPALRLDGRRVQGSLAILQALEDAVPEPSLYPADPALRAQVRRAEAWGESVLQPVPRRLIRHTLVRSQAQRRWFARTALTQLPAPGAVATLLAPTSRGFAALVRSNPATVARDLATLDEHLDHVDTLIAGGVIGGAAVNAADFQIAPSVRVLYAFDDLRERVAAHEPAAALALRLVPDYPDIPAALPVS